jgi:fructose-1,6-bisphosphatase I
VLAQAVAAPVEAPVATTKKSQYELQTLTTWLLDLEKNGVIDNELAAVISSISTACKQIGSLVNRAGISNLTGLAGEQNVQGEDQKKLDVISNEVFGNCLRSSGRTGVIASEEEDLPVAVEETFSGEYVVVFDPLDGSSNIDAGISVGSIFGIYEPSPECSIEDMDDPGGWGAPLLLVSWGGRLSRE